MTKLFNPEEDIIRAENVSGIVNISDSNGNLVWPYIRMYFYYWYLDKIASSSKRRSHMTNASYLKRMIKFLFQWNIFKSILSPHKDYMIISSQRYVDGEEIYTRDIKPFLNGNYIEYSFTNSFTCERGPIYLDSVKIYFKILSFLFSRYLKVKDEVSAFKIELNLGPEFIKFYKLYYFEYKCWYYYYLFLLIFKKYKRIIIVGGIYYSPLIAAAERRNIEVMEIQHGVINNLHLAYEFKNIKRNTFFPHKLLLFSDYWKEVCNYPIGTDLIEIGNSQYSNLEKELSLNSDGLLFIGSPRENDLFIKFLSINIEFIINLGRVINFRLHPTDRPNWRNKYPTLLKWSELGFVQVCDGTQSLASRFKRNSIVFCIDSTVVYESLWYGCKTFLMEGVHLRFLKRIVESGDVILIPPTFRLKTIDLMYKKKLKPTELYFVESKKDKLSQLFDC